VIASNSNILLLNLLIFWYNGNLIQGSTLELAIDDPGLLYGATVFTTVRVYSQSLDSALTNWQGHRDRIESTLQTFGWQQPNWNRLRQGAEILIAHFPVLRITVFPDGREWIIGRELPDSLTEKQRHGISASVLTGQFQRSLPTHKTGNYLSAWLAKTTAQQMLAQEAILVDASGSWLETTTGNLWGWRNGSWWTPPITAGILPGVVRSQLVDWLRRNHQPVREEPWLPQLGKSFAAIAYTNSVVEVIPIHTVIKPTSQLTYNAYHPCFQQLRGLFCT
jgi:4-amino-4-deoxychorismate lyase